MLNQFKKHVFKNLNNRINIWNLSKYTWRTKQAENLSPNPFFSARFQILMRMFKLLEERFLNWEFIGQLKVTLKKFPGLTKKLLHIFCITLGVVICGNHVAKPLDSFNKCRKFLLPSQETFFCRNLKNDRLSFSGQCNVETNSRPGI